MRHPGYPLLALCCLIPLFTQAQQIIEEQLPITSIESVRFTSKYADLSVELWDGDVIAISGAASVNNGRNDEAFQLSSRIRNGRLEIETLLTNEDQLPRYAVAEHDGQRYYLDEKDPNAFERLKETHGSTGWNLMGNTLMVDAALTIRIPYHLAVELQSTYGNLELNNWSESVRAKTTYGQVVASFSSVPTNGEVWLRSDYKLIDVAIAPFAEVTVDAESDYGAIFTNLPLQINTEQSEVKDFSDRIVGALNGGGSARIRIVTPYGNIYLREG